MDVEAERARDLLQEEQVEIAAVDPADHLGGDPSGGPRPVQHAARPGVVLRAVQFEQRGHHLRVLDVALVEVRRHARETGGERQHVPQRHRALAAHRELRPVVGDGPVQRERAHVGEQQDRRGQDSVGARQHRFEGVAGPRCPGDRVGGAVPQVDDRLAVPYDRQRGPWEPAGPASRQARSKEWRTEANPGAVVPWTSAVVGRGRGRGRTCRTREVVMSRTPEVVGSQGQGRAVCGPGSAHTSGAPAG